MHTFAKPWVLLPILAVAAAVYFTELGRSSLSSSEAYSALAAGQHNIRAVMEKTWRFDPGKPGLYQALLHEVCERFGQAEATLRVPSALCALASVLIIFLIGKEVFGPENGAAAAALWAFNPLIVILGRWARPYAMFVALALGQTLAFFRLRARPARLQVLVCAFLTAALLYTHLGGLLWIGAELALLVRDLYGKRNQPHAWLALALGVLAFCPYLPLAAHQGNELLFGHFLNYIGNAQAHSSLIKGTTVLVAFTVGALLIFGRSLEEDPSEPVRACAICALLPIVAIIVCSMLLHPIFGIRYVAPCFGLMAVLAAGCLDAAGTRFRNLTVAAVTSAFLLMVPLYVGGDPEPWREIAQIVGDRAKPSEPVFFEINIVDDTSGRANQDFPEGFLRVPFDRYFAGVNPRRTLPDFDPAAARAVAAREAASGSGAWLISGRKRDQVLAELPNAGFTITPVFCRGVITVYHFVPQSTSASR